jgi:hypothetical protein
VKDVRGGGRGLYTGEYHSPPVGGNISRCHLGENMKRGREKGENVGVKGRKQIERGKMSSKRVK